ncbi:hypothetical protein Tco_0653514 [Tanacetum coccineum]|uniref:Uncharacterized protein n=1 Tax=Tanacetum coccineum TaxID=301880 RepID=A0ABQ4X139_9ASTR
MLKVSPWKGVVRFGKRGKLNPRYVGPFKGDERVGECHADEPLAVPLVDFSGHKLHFVRNRSEISGPRVKRLKRVGSIGQSSMDTPKRGMSIWGREDHSRRKYPQTSSPR